MNYIEQINLLHRIRRKDSLPATAVALHILLLDACNRDDWDNPFRLKNRQLQRDLDTHYNTFVNAREKLRRSGLISFKAKQGCEDCEYRINTTAECTKIREQLAKEVFQNPLGEGEDAAKIYAPAGRKKSAGKVKEEKLMDVKGNVDGNVEVDVDGNVEVDVKDNVEVNVEVDAVCIRGIIKQNNKQNQTKNNLAVDEPPPLFSENEFDLNTKQPNNTAAGGGAANNPQPATHQRCMQIYFNWFKQQFGVLPKIDGQQGKALNDLISYFAAQLPKQTNGLAPTPAAVSNSVCQSLELVLNSWHQLDAFHQKQTKLSQLASNIQNIIVQLKKPANATQQKQHASEQTPLWRR